jgi:diketogulonate reductase-like aldo/keto reductase
MRPSNATSMGSNMHTVDSHGAQIPVLGFATYGMSDAVLSRLIPAALNAGFRHIDTAQIYGNEAGVGEAWVASGLARSQVLYHHQDMGRELRARAVRAIGQ